MGGLDILFDIFMVGFTAGGLFTWWYLGMPQKRIGDKKDTQPDRQ